MLSSCETGIHVGIASRPLLRCENAFSTVGMCKLQIVRTLTRDVRQLSCKKYSIMPYSTVFSESGIDTEDAMVDGLRFFLWSYFSSIDTYSIDFDIEFSVV